MLSFVGDTERIRDQEGALYSNLNSAVCGAAKSDGAFGDKVGIALDLRGDLVEQFVDSDECWSAHVPMRLFHLGMKINCRCQVLVQKFD